MRGVVTTRRLFTHGLLICRLFGVRAYLRCLRAVLAGRRVTFLELAVSSGP